MSICRCFSNICTYPDGGPEQSRLLHVRIIGAAKSFGGHPRDVLRRVLNVAGFAVNAVLRINLKALALLVLNDLIDPRRTVALCGFIVQGQVLRDGNIRIS